ncbi:MAG: PEP-CTERM sorting domain-containing protein [Fimbriimonadia bacterium]|jgi:hypothetical protein
MRIIIALSALAVCSAAFSQTAATVSGELQQWRIGNGAPTPGPLTLYDNTDPSSFSGYYFPGDPVNFWGVCDDVHMTSGGLINGFEFVYYDPVGNTALTQVEWAVFEMSTYDTGPVGAYVSGGILTGLPGDGLWQVQVDLTGGGEFVASADLWFCMAFAGAYSDSPEAGWVIYDPPVVGSSHDLFLNFSDQALYNFNGAPVASFGLRMYAVPEPGALAAIGTGLVGLLALRRRK